MSTKSYATFQNLLEVRCSLYVYKICDRLDDAVP